jgi:hypothetical protein
MSSFAPVPQQAFAEPLELGRLRNGIGLLSLLSQSSCWRPCGTFACDFHDNSQAGLALVYDLGSIPSDHGRQTRCAAETPMYCSVV